jgi:molecular chaperone DnaK
LHLEVEISRDEYEAMIRPLVESTLDSVSKALQDSGKKPGDMDAILLVGGSTRTPLVSSLLSKRPAWSRGRTCIRISPWRWAPG